MSSIVLAQLVIPHETFFPPLGLLYIADALEQAGHRVTVFHEKARVFTYKKLIKVIEKEKPLFIGFSTMTGPQLLPTIHASEMIKKRFGIPIVWGGIHPTILPEQTLREKYVDIVVIGEGEETIVELVDALEKNGYLSKIKGIAYKDKGNIRINPSRPFIKDLDKFHLAWHLVEIKRYFQKVWKCRRVLPIVTSRGCPHRCGFCYNLAVHKRRWRGNSAQRICSDIKRLKEKYDIDGIIFYDDNFFTSTPRAIKILKETDIHWFAEIRADYISDELVTKISEHGCKMLFTGAESGSDRVLKDVVHKDITTQDVLNAVTICKQHNILLDISFIIGFPGETNEEMMKTLSLMKYLDEIYPNQTLTVKFLTPYPGTPLWASSIQLGFKPPEETKRWASFTRGKRHLPWIRKQKILDLMIVFNLAYSYKIPILKFLCKKRIKHNIFLFLWEIWIFRFLVKLREFLSRF